MTFRIASIIFSVCALAAVGTSIEDRIRFAKREDVTSDTVIDYLVENGHLNSHSFTNPELRRALRKFQRENGLQINGLISTETIQAVQTDLNLMIVIHYLKTYNYIQGHVTPQKTKSGVEKLQYNLGWLVTGNVDRELVDFVKNNKERSYAEPIFVS
jgi:hypothetical protein